MAEDFYQSYRKRMQQDDPAMQLGQQILDAWLRWRGEQVPTEEQAMAGQAMPMMTGAVTGPGGAPLSWGGYFSKALETDRAAKAMKQAKKPMTMGEYFTKSRDVDREMLQKRREWAASRRGGVEVE